MINDNYWLRLHVNRQTENLFLCTSVITYESYFHYSGHRRKKEIIKSIWICAIYIIN